MKLKLALNLFFLTLLPIAEHSIAATIYSYVGGDFNYYGFNFPIAGTQVKRIEFTLTTSAPIIPNTYHQLEAASYKLNDGYTFIDNTSPGWSIVGWVKTNDNGDVFNWAYRVERAAPWAVGAARILDSQRVTNTYTQFEDFAVYDYWVDREGYSASGAQARSYTVEGKWSVAFDADGDGVADTADNCLSVPNADQLNTDGTDDGGDACDEDDDNDDWFDVDDNCPLNANLNQEDADKDGVGNACDNCLFTANPNQEDTDSDGLGDACESIGC